MFLKPENRLSNIRGKVKVAVKPCVEACLNLETGCVKLVRSWKKAMAYIYPGKSPVRF